ncbi:DUF4124 domain-containing protein [Variovorax rhizosphaerae]|uniref:DUF4124 domain-containing protein n=1 Tax=Variovorax rhizosphaerae TaxID=1836200 RepID=A0ABU8WFJ4_9BURK
MRLAILVAGLPLALGCAASAVQAQPAQPPTNAPGIFSCVDAYGRTITSDRPIADCLDREQRELTPSGTVRRRLEPSYTAKEQAEREERARQAQIAAAKQTDERRRERALLMRYPNDATHERDRAEALGQIDAVIQSARKRQGELADERKKIDAELEFYRNDISRAPPALRRQVEESTQSLGVQNRFIGEQEEEKRRVNQRFDDERTRLRQLWAPEVTRK